MDLRYESDSTTTSGLPEGLRRGPFVILGSPDSIFVRQLSAEWRRRGADVVIVKLRGEDGALPDGTPVLSGEREAGGLSLSRRLAGRCLHEVWRFHSRLRHRRYSGADEGGVPSFVDPLILGPLAARRARRLHPAFVFGQEAFSHGVATALCRGFPRILMPWGGDIMLYAETSAISFSMVRWALRSVDLVCPTSVAGAEHVIRRFGVSDERVRSLSWGVDRQLFHAASAEQRIATRRSFGLESTHPLVMNVRRFLPVWGSEAVVEAFLLLAKELPHVSFVLLGGHGSEPFVRAARQRIAQTAFASRFVFFDGDLPLAECARLMAASDVFVSLMRLGDMRSASVLQAACTGAVPVLGEHPEYRELEKLGFRAQFVNPDRPAEVAAAVRLYLEDGNLLKMTRDANQLYIAEYEDLDTQMQRLLDAICATADRALRRAKPYGHGVDDSAAPFGNE